MADAITVSSSEKGSPPPMAPTNAGLRAIGIYALTLAVGIALVILDETVHPKH